MLTVIVGGMFAEKSTELQRRGKRLKRAGKEIMFFKPDFDVRYSTDELVTHDGHSVKAFNIPTKNPDILLGTDFSGVDAILIDEVQFISSDIFFTIESLLIRYPEMQIIVAGLDLDFEGRPFMTTSWLMASAEEVIKLKAVCSSCGSDSWVSYKEPNGQRIELGTDEYKPMCRKCFNKKLQGAN
jgi:thymidine kinase